MKCNQSRPGFELVSSCPFPTTIIITPGVLYPVHSLGKFCSLMYSSALADLAKIRFGFFVEWHINLCGLINAKVIPVEKQQWYNLSHSWMDKRWSCYIRLQNDINFFKHCIHEYSIWLKGIFFKEKRYIDLSKRCLIESFFFCWRLIWT